MVSATLVEFLFSEYIRDIENLRDGIKPPAALRAVEEMKRALSILGISDQDLATLQFAWTFRSKGTRLFNRDGSVALDKAGKPVTIGRRCAMYVRLPCDIPLLNLPQGSYLGVIGNVSTQSTNVFTSEYFLVAPYSEKIWAIVGVMDSRHSAIITSLEEIASGVDRAIARSGHLKALRVERQKKAAEAADAQSRSSAASPASKASRRRVKKAPSETSVAVPEVSVPVANPEEQKSESLPNGTITPDTTSPEYFHQDVSPVERFASDDYDAFDQQTDPFALRSWETRDEFSSADSFGTLPFEESNLVFSSYNDW